MFTSIIDKSWGIELLHWTKRQKLSLYFFVIKKMCFNSIIQINET